AVATVAGAARGDDLDQPAEPALRVLLGQPGDLSIERRFGLPFDEIGAGPVDEEQDSDHRQRKDQKIKPGEAKRVGSDQPLRRPEQRDGPVRRGKSALVWI